MQKILIKLMEAAEIKSIIAKQESACWQKIAEGVGAYQKSLAKFKTTDADGNTYMSSARSLRARA